MEMENALIRKDLEEERKYSKQLEIEIEGLAYFPIILVAFFADVFAFMMFLVYTDPFKLKEFSYSVLAMIIFSYVLYYFRYKKWKQ